MTRSTQRPLGFAVKDWQPRQLPDGRALFGRTVSLVRFNLGKHGLDLWRAFAEDKNGALWDYMAYGPFADYASFADAYRRVAAGDDPLFYSIIDKETGQPAGVASYLRVTPQHGSIEIGHICLAPRLQRTVTATEALFLMMRHALDELGYRRLEWKCDDLNETSKRAAVRLGFRFEGVFRQHLVVKGRNRDSAWYAIIDRDWPALRSGFDQWLKPDNFDGSGRQKKPLSHFMPKSEEDCHAAAAAGKAR